VTTRRNNWRLRVVDLLVAGVDDNRRRRGSGQRQRHEPAGHPCENIVLSNNVFDSGGGVKTSGYSKFGTQRPGATVGAFESALHNGVCDGAILRRQA